MYPLQRWALTQKTPEMNELESDKQNLKRGDLILKNKKMRAKNQITFFSTKKGD